MCGLASLSQGNQYAAGAQWTSSDVWQGGIVGLVGLVTQRVWGLCPADMQPLHTISCIISTHHLPARRQGHANTGLR